MTPNYINKWIQTGIEVAKPEEEVKNFVRDVALLAEGI